MRSICLYISVFVLSLWGQALCAQNADRFVSANYGFSILKPKGWVTQRPDIAAVVLSLADKGGGNIDVLVEEKIGGLDAADFQKRNLKIMRDESDDFKLKDTGKKTINGLSAAWMSYLEKDSGKKTLEYYFVLDGKGFIVVGSVDEKKYDNYEKTFRTIAESFQKEKKK